MTTTDNNDKPPESNDKLREPTKTDPSADGGGCFFVILAAVILIWLNWSCNDPRGINKARRDEAEFQRAFDRDDNDEMRRIMKRQADEKKR